MAACGAATPSRQPLVLIVEDDPDIRHFYILALERAGFRTDEAHNGLQALDKVFDSRPDLIVADIAIPGMDGIELCRRLRADERTRSVPVLAMTGYGGRHYPDRARRAGADHVLIKPCDAETLVAEARRLLAAAVPAADASADRAPTWERAAPAPDPR
jgi:two-component system, cell cycle response regulator DivK